MEFTITKENILKASEKCSTAKQTLEILFPEAFKQNVIHKAGNKYKLDGEKYMIVRSPRSNCSVVLISLDGGNYYSSDTEVSGGSWFSELTPKEWKTIAGYRADDFELIK